MSADWTAIAKALANWAQEASGLTAIWEGQNRAPPPGDYVTLALDGPIPVGRDSVRYVTDLAREAGREVEVRVVGERECHLQVQAFTQKTHGGTAANRVIGKLQLALSLPSTGEDLEAAGIAVFDVGPVQNIPALLDADIRGRASMRVRFYVRDSVSDFTGYIATVEGSVTLGEDEPIPFTAGS